MPMHAHRIVVYLASVFQRNSFVNIFMCKFFMFTYIHKASAFMCSKSQLNNSSFQVYTNTRCRYIQFYIFENDFSGPKHYIRDNFGVFSWSEGSKDEESNFISAMFLPCICSVHWENGKTAKNSALQKRI